MRPSAIVPLLLSLGTLVLSFIVLFAGTKTSFLPNFDILTLNTSRIGHGDLTADVMKDHPDLAALLQDNPEAVKAEVEKAIDEAVKELGVHQFYSVHILSYCEGTYSPTPLPNVTYRLSDIKKNYISCSSKKAFFQFDPETILQKDLDALGGEKVNVADLRWPADVGAGLHSLHVAQKATFILYVISMGTAAASAAFAAIGFCTSGRFSACVNVMIAIVGFLATGLASALITVGSIKGSAEINKYTHTLGVEAIPGHKILGLSWGATGAMLICILWWSVECSAARKRSRQALSQ